MLQMYSIRDTKTGAFERPFFVRHVQEAIRSVEQAFQAREDQQPWFCKYPADFALYLIGTFDPDTGFVFPTAEKGPQHTIEIAALQPQRPKNTFPMKEGNTDA